MRWSGLVAAVLLAVALTVSACDDDGVAVDAPDTIVVSSTALSDGGSVPAAHTCDGDDVPPDLSWSEVPPDTVEVVVVVDDPDAPRGTFTHWTVWGLGPAEALADGQLPPAAIEGTNDFDEVGYRGPCPPAGDDAHRYRFRVVAVDAPVDLPEDADPDELAAALEDTVIAHGELTASYGR
jgi:Raf kinase inhibitor-like YbhB/YbcL family protein